MTANRPPRRAVRPLNGEILRQQRVVCAKYGAEFASAPAALKVGISETVRQGLLPVNGLREHQVGDTTGWYIWAGGEISDDPDFFVPLHVGHLADWCPEVLPYLGLGPGWRLLIAPGHVDVWYDEKLAPREGR